MKTVKAVWGRVRSCINSCLGRVISVDEVTRSLTIYTILTRLNGSCLGTTHTTFTRLSHELTRVHTTAHGFTRPHTRSYSILPKSCENFKHKSDTIGQAKNVLRSTRSYTIIHGHTRLPRFSNTTFTRSHTAYTIVQSCKSCLLCDTGF